ncbi:MAG: cytochrome b [Acinetobacter sp.]|nr:cytochrome b [Acinetobacter sp.]
MPVDDISQSNHSPKSLIKNEKWSILVRLFHWIGALFLIAAYFTAEILHNIGIHKAIGVSFLLWTIARLLNRLVTTAPANVPMPKWQTAIAHATHTGLYLAMFAMPMTGLMMSMYAGRETDVFGLFSIPVLVTPNGEMAGVMNGLHTDVWWVILLILVVMHILAALQHQFIKKDGLINRMR